MMRVMEESFNRNNIFDVIFSEEMRYDELVNYLEDFLIRENFKYEILNKIPDNNELIMNIFDLTHYDRILIENFGFARRCSWN